MNLYLEYLQEVENDLRIEAALAAEAALAEEEAMLDSMTAEEKWIYFHGCN